MFKKKHWSVTLNLSSALLSSVISTMIPNCNNMPDFGLCPNIQALLYSKEGPIDYALVCGELCHEAPNRSEAEEEWDPSLEPSS